MRRFALISVLAALACYLAGAQEVSSARFASALFWDSDHPFLIYDAVLKKDQSQNPEKLRTWLVNLDASGSLDISTNTVAWAQRGRRYLALRNRYQAKAKGAIRVEAKKGGFFGSLWCLDQGTNWAVVAMYRGYLSRSRPEVEVRRTTVLPKGRLDSLLRDALVQPVRTDMYHKIDTRNVPYFLISLWRNGSYHEAMVAEPGLPPYGRFRDVLGGKETRKKNLDSAAAFLKKLDALVEEPFYGVLSGDVRGLKDFDEGRSQR